MKRVVITGIGVVCPLGDEKEQIVQAMKEKKCAIKEIKSFDHTPHLVKLAAEVDEFNSDEYIDKKAAKRMDRCAQMAIVAAKKALKDSGLDAQTDLFLNNTRVGVSLATGIGGLSTIETEHYRGIKRGFDKVSPFFIPMAIANMPSALVAIELGVHGSNQCVVTACASSTNAIGESFRKIKDGYMDIMFTGGCEASITEFGIGGFTSMTALTTSQDPDRASVPFDKERSGFVMGEGAGVLVLEERESALKRGANIYAEIIGYGESCDAFHISAPNEDGFFAQLAMKNALEEANITPDQVDYINAHGTSTPLNDKIESKAICNIFGNCPVSSTKSQIGHLLGASGAVDSILSIYAMNEGFYPVTINHKVHDEEIKANVITELKDADINCFVKSSLGFGGHNAILIFKKHI
ncbi:MAG: beta-ketoacyl-ACP synthase II [Bacillota bacterium]|nr:beta-ketoacyl-ACP synthase II [Bacillota bacterium]